MRSIGPLSPELVVLQDMTRSEASLTPFLLAGAWHERQGGDVPVEIALTSQNLVSATLMTLSAGLCRRKAALPPYIRRPQGSIGGYATAFGTRSSCEVSGRMRAY